MLYEITRVMSLVVIGWVIFTNILVTVGLARSEGSFAQKWDDEVKEDQDTKVGRFLMRTYYFVPTIISAIAR